MKRNCRTDVINLQIIRNSAAAYFQNRSRPCTYSAAVIILTGRIACNRAALHDELSSIHTTNITFYEYGAAPICGAIISNLCTIQRNSTIIQKANSAAPLLSRIFFNQTTGQFYSCIPHNHGAAGLRSFIILYNAASHINRTAVALYCICAIID